ncbi:diaminobutyrate--2-oxoglutarate transaminase family protein [Hamadaea tsunoensis]|uniref:diaminobutyrate--2-oxoglutarate transaminase family protein n=1 Tax=Hamadaea tsunoensis TaxID=53368 RepID=UPI0009FE1BB5|nr:diaminobutyrate--2-oxoglutarate transaminase family protein [Hamadaea tsunoensis]
MTSEPILRGPRVGGPLPGPRSAALLERQRRHESNARSYPRRLPVALRRGQGSYVEDVDGNVFIDFLTAAGVLPLGHTHPDVVAATKAQLDLLVTGLDFPTQVKYDFVDAHLALLPPEMREHVRFQFCGPAGADAVDAALKLCKTATGRGTVLAFHGAFHGSTHSALALTGFVAPKEPLANLMPGVHFLPFPYAYRCPLGAEPSECGQRCIDYVERVLRDPASGIPRPAAVIIEAVQGEGGVIPASVEFLRGLRRVTAELDIPLIVDEIQTGYGRTGHWFAFEAAGITPDVVLMSKAAGGIGLPTALIAYHEKLDRWAPAAHTGTFRGNQLAFAAGLTAINVMRETDILENVVAQGKHAMERLGALADEVPEVGDVRGRGLMLGVEVIEPGSGRPDGDLGRRIQRRALENGLMLEVGGRGGEVVRLLPPLNIDRPTLDLALDILSDAVLHSVSTGGPGASRPDER